MCKHFDQNFFWKYFSNVLQCTTPSLLRGVSYLLSNLNSLVCYSHIIVKGEGLCLIWQKQHVTPENCMKLCLGLRKSPFHTATNCYQNVHNYFFNEKKIKLHFSCLILNKNRTYIFNKALVDSRSKLKPKKISYGMLLSYFCKMNIWLQQKIRYLILILTPIGNPPVNN